MRCRINFETSKDNSVKARPFGQHSCFLPRGTGSSYMPARIRLCLSSTFCLSSLSCPARIHAHLEGLQANILLLLLVLRVVTMLVRILLTAIILLVEISSLGCSTSRSGPWLSQCLELQKLFWRMFFYWSLCQSLPNRPQTWICGMFWM